jgi:hypothetical protein
MAHAPPSEGPQTQLGEAEPAAILATPEVSTGYRRSASLVSGIETMDKTPTADFAQRCDTTFQTPGTFATMRDLVAREVWPSYFAPVIDLEATAIRIHGWEMRVVPGVASGDHPGTDGPILVYDFVCAPSVAYTECKGGGRIIESADEVGDVMMIVNMIPACPCRPGPCWQVQPGQQLGQRGIARTVSPPA